MLQTGKRIQDKVQIQILEFEQFAAIAERFHSVDAVPMNLRKHRVSAVDFRGSLTNPSAHLAARWQPMGNNPTEVGK